MTGAGDPGLQQRTIGGKREERQPDGDREQAKQPQCFPGRGWSAPARSDRERQREHAAIMTAIWITTDRKPPA